TKIDSLQTIAGSRGFFRGPACLSPPGSSLEPSSNQTLNYHPSREGIFHAGRPCDPASLPPSTLRHSSPLEAYALVETQTSPRLKPSPSPRNPPATPTSA